jgi:hypothetical protein
MESDRRQGERPMVAQVGGTHYQSEYQHWDWVEDMGMGYLEGNATKYVSRWRKKNGIEDLKKALTYVEKLLVRWYMGRRNRGPGETHGEVYEQFHRWCEINEVKDKERDVCYTLAFWYSPGDLRHAHSVITALIKGEEKEACKT